MATLQFDDDAALREDAIASALLSLEPPTVAGVPDLAAFLRLYYQQVALADVLAFDPIDLVGAGLASLRAAGERLPSDSNVRVYTPSVDEHGWSNGHTVIEVCTPDMPFLVDSITAALSLGDLGIHLVIHPVFWVTRDEHGRLLSVAGSEPDADAQWEGAAGWESWIHVDVDRDTDLDRLEALADQIEGILRDVKRAVTDWLPMQHAATTAAQALRSGAIPGVDPTAQSEAADFLGWLADRHFTFLGYRAYELTREDSELALQAIPGTGLGILRNEGDRPAHVLPPAVQQRALERVPLILTKANSRATVHRSTYMDYVGVKTFDASGAVVGEHRFLGLYSAAAYNQSVMAVPVLRAKCTAVLQASGVVPDSHLGKDLQQFLETYPRDEVFQSEPSELLAVAREVLGLQERRRTRLFLRKDPYGRFISCMVYLPRDRYTTAVRRRVEDLLLKALNGDSVDYTTRVSESVLARLHYVVRAEPPAELHDPDLPALQRELERTTRSWNDDFTTAVNAAMSEQEATALLSRFDGAIPEAYKEAFPARTAVADMQHLASLAPGSTEVNLYHPMGAKAKIRGLKIYRCGEGASISSILPILRDLGAEVIQEQPFLVVDSEGISRRIYDVEIVFELTSVQSPETAKERFEAAFLAAWHEYGESDGLNALVLKAGLTWQEVAAIRALTRYLRQAGSGFTPEYVTKVLLEYAEFARLLVDLIHARFDPALSEQDRNSNQEVLQKRIREALDEVDSLDVDRILRGLLTLIQACCRTSFFRPQSESEPLRISFKFWSERIPDLPAPRPLFDLWVYSPTVEGVHLRFAQVARGGLRWSDRPEDFRTEVLGLVKAQEVKNSVIVPAGAKGGFYPKRAPAAKDDRAGRLAAARSAYSEFISGLLDLTDNRTGKLVVPPKDVVRHDEDDPYLVVAADKGTATFSDLANAISAEYGFWLGDAFASGGSDGYDHKAMGITARGAWESVSRHFRELGINSQTDEFTCFGIGDMSGDVFGNGMLCSSTIRLVAAFDHRHIFIDPDPDAATSYAERQRLFNLPRSSWADYDPDLISTGGGVFPRQAKSIRVSAQMAQVLGISSGATTVTPPELIKLILTAPIDLFWNGGIGTYVKASTQSNAEVGDKSNDLVRVNGKDLRCRVIGEGGNLGLTQPGRIEAALAGVQLNTDAIDNSAGVDTSDHEVNLKILLDAVIAAGDLTVKQRNELLVSMTQDVTDLVLADNYSQNNALGLARGLASRMLPIHGRMMARLSEAGRLDLDLEYLPSALEIQDREQQGLGLTSPELCVLLAYAKISLADAVAGDSFAADPYFERDLVGYFPPAVNSAYRGQILAHPLAEEITTTVVVSELVDRGGITFVSRILEETAATEADIVRAFTFAKDVFDLPEYWRRVEALDNQVSTEVQGKMYGEAKRLLDRVTRWLLGNRGAKIDLSALVAQYHATVAALTPDLASLFRGEELIRHQEQLAALEQEGVPKDLAKEAGAVLDRFSLLDVADISVRTECEPAAVAALYFCVTERFGVDALLTRITLLAREDRWDALARQALRSDLYQAVAALTAQVVRGSSKGASAQDRMDEWEASNAAEIGRVRHTLAEIGKIDQLGLAGLSVALRSIRTLVAQSRN